MTTATDKLALPYLQPGQALKIITHNEALRRIDSGLYLSCSDMNAPALPEDPADGLCLVLSPGAGSPLEHAGDIGIFLKGVWDWFTPSSGFVLWDEAGQTLRVFDGAGWVLPVKQQALETLPSLGLNTPATSAQRLALASDTSLFSHDGDSHRMSVNRAADTNVASLIFQTNFAGEAEIGLAGDQGFSVKTSADGGVNWAERLTTPSDYAGIRAPAFGSIRAYIGSNTAQFIETPATGGIFAITIVSDGQFPRVSHSGLIAYDTGQSPALVVLAKTARLEVHGDMILDGTISAPDNIGVSAVDGGLYVENRINNQRVISLTFLC